MIRVNISSQKKGMSPKDEWQGMGVIDTTYHTTMKEAKDYLKAKYGKHKREPIYLDTKSRGTIQNGWCFSFRDWEFTSQGGRYYYIQQDWAAFDRVEAIDVTKEK